MQNGDTNKTGQVTLMAKRRPYTMVSFGYMRSYRKIPGAISTKLVLANTKSEGTLLLNNEFFTKIKDGTITAIESGCRPIHDSKLPLPQSS